MCPFLALPLLFLLLPCPALLNQPTGTRPPWAHTPPESSEAAPNQSPDPALVLPSSSKHLNPRAARDVDPDPDPAQPPIKVLLTETCVQRDASAEGEGEGLTLDLEPGSPLVVTHRISLVPGPGACAGGCEALVSALQERMERLEREVSALREKCGGTEGGCCTSQQSTGAHCTRQPEDMCPNDCSDQGRCDQGKCICFPGFSGPDCSSTTCPSNCNDRGTCVKGQCVCEDGFTALTGVSRLGSRDITDSSVTLFWTLPPVQYDAYLITFTSQTSTKSVDVQWEPPLANIDRYRLSIAASQSKGGEEPATREITLPPERDSAHITGLEAGHVYDIALVSEKGRSQSQPITVEATPAYCTLPIPMGHAATDTPQGSTVYGLANHAAPLCTAWPITPLHCVRPGQSRCSTVYGLANHAAPLCTARPITLLHCVRPGQSHRSTVYGPANHALHLSTAWPITPLHCVRPGQSRPPPEYSLANHAAPLCTAWPITPLHCVRPGQSRPPPEYSLANHAAPPEYGPANHAAPPEYGPANHTAPPEYGLANHAAPPETTDTDIGPDRTREPHSGTEQLDDKGGSLDTVSMTNKANMTSNSAITKGVVDSSRDEGNSPGDNGGSLETVSMTTGSGTDSDGTRDQYSGSQKLEDKGGSLETVSMTNKAKVTHTTKGVVESSRDKGNNGVEGGGITVAGGHEGGPLRSGHPGLRKPPIRRPHIGPFRNRTRPNLAARYHPSKGPYRRPGISNSLQRQQGGDSLGKTNSTGTRVSPSGQALATNSSNVKTRHNYYKIVRKITSIQADLHPNTSSTKRVGFRKVIVYTPVGLKSRANLGSSAPRTGPDFTSIGVENVTSSGFVLIWEVPPGIYQNFTVTRWENGDEGMPERKTEEDRKEDEDEKEDEEVDEGRRNEVRVGSRRDDSRSGDVSRSEINFPAEPHEKTPKFSQVLPGSARSLLFRDLAPQANYSLTLSGTAPGLWSKIHQFTVATGPRPPSDLSFSGVTDNSVTVAWTKPKGPVSGYKVTYTHTNEGEPVSVETDSQDSAVSLHELSPGSTYEVSVISLLGMDESDPIKDFVVTLPDPPSDLQAINVTHSTALLLWKPAQTTVDHYIIVYGSEQGVSTVVSGDVAELPLTGLQSSTQYTVTISSQRDGLRSTGASTIFTTAGVPDPPSDLQAINVTHSTALLLWKPAQTTVDHYIIVYGSEQGVSTVVSGDVAELPLTGLQSSTQYTVTISSQRDGLRSTGASTIFTTAGGPDESRQKGPRKLTASNVTPRSAVLSWKPPPVAVAGYKLTYQTAGREAKEVTLDPSTTQYKLSRLHPRSKYTVHLQGERQGEYTSATSTKFTTGVLRYPFPSDCSQELLNGMQDSGEAEIFPGGQRGRAVPIFCDMETDGGGWTVFQRRVDGHTNFFRTWSEYSRGFGNVSRDFWLGNDLLHSLTSVLPMAMRVDLRVGAESTYAHYASFAVDTEKRYYALALSGYSGTAGDSMAYHNLSRFSTWDRDSNPYVTRCAMSYRGGWWYRNCHEANLNGLYNTHTNHQGVIWTSWKGTDFSIPFSEMKIRPASFTPPSQG
ncbi:tenascin-R-like [Conger conger]|uniref:tenascin-R-like n=1 Tax=Conger conger TaxID=82655 RepID=UPI002A5ADA99|nr:tenascin-R-like [Conger conger]